MKITAAKIKELRERTGAGMMDCKRVLQETGGDLKRAADVMRAAGVAIAERKAGRRTKEGAVTLRLDASGGAGVLVEIGCETDFVARNERFRRFLDQVGDCVLAERPRDVAALASLRLPGGETVEQARHAAIAQLGENVGVRRFNRLEAGRGEALYGYVHGGGRIGVMVRMRGGDAELGRDLAMHVCWAQPLYLNEATVPKERIERERDLFREQAKREDKPEQVFDRYVQGKLAKFLRGVVLDGQAFVKDTDRSVRQVLETAGAEALEFVRLEVGEDAGLQADGAA